MNSCFEETKGLPKAKKYLNYPEQQTAKHDLHRKLCIINKKRILNMEKLHCIKDKNRA